MTRLIAIVIFISIATLIFRFHTNEKIQKSVMIGVITAFFLYVVVLVSSELFR